MRFLLPLTSFALLAGCAGTPTAPDDGVTLAPIRLAEGCRMAEALALAERAVAESDPSSLRHRRALQDQAVLLRDRDEEAAAARVESVVAELDRRSLADVQSEMRRDWAALRERRATVLGRADC